jgi:hypothetical protein
VSEDASRELNTLVEAELVDAAVSPISDLAWSRRTRSSKSKVPLQRSAIVKGSLSRVKAAAMEGSAGSSAMFSMEAIEHIVRSIQQSGFSVLYTAPYRSGERP